MSACGVRAVGVSGCGCGSVGVGGGYADGSEVTSLVKPVASLV